MSLSVEALLGVATETAALRTVVALCVVTLQHFPHKDNGGRVDSERGHL